MCAYFLKWFYGNLVDILCWEDHPKFSQNIMKIFWQLCIAMICNLFGAVTIMSSSPPEIILHACHLLIINNYHMRCYNNMECYFDMGAKPPNLEWKWNHRMRDPEKISHHLSSIYGVQQDWLESLVARFLETPDVQTLMTVSFPWLTYSMSDRTKESCDCSLLVKLGGCNSVLQQLLSMSLEF